MRRIQAGLLIACVAFVAPVLFPPSSASGQSAEEGRVYEFAEGEQISWRPPAGTYHLIAHGGPAGADLDLTEMKTAGGQTSVALRSNSTHILTAVEFDGMQSKTLKVVKGEGSAILARPDLTRRTLSDPNSNIQATAVVPVNACRAYAFNSWQMFEPFGLEGSGEGFIFRVMDLDMRPLGEQRNRLNLTLDPSEHIEVLVQACRETQGDGNLRTWVTYPASLPKTQTKADHTWLYLGAAAIGISAAVGGVVALRLHRRRRP